MAARPLSALTYLARNPRRVAPVLGIQALVTGLLVAIITPTNAFEATSEAYVRTLSAFTMVVPRGRFDFDEDLEGLLDANPGMARRTRVRLFWIRTPMIVGEAYAPLVALDAAEVGPFLERVGAHLVEGTLPEPGSEGVAIHAGILRARGLALGEAFGQRLDDEEATPGLLRVVGVLDGPARVGVADLAHTSRPLSEFARSFPFEVVYAAPGRKRESDRHLHEATLADGSLAFRVFDEAYVRRRTEKTLANLPLIVGFITGSVAIVVALVTALLNLIAFQARQDEFALLMAVGHRRGRLVAKLALESTLTALAGWAVGLVAGWAAVAAFRSLALEPRGILMDLFDGRPLLFSFAVPALSAGASALLLARRLRRMDPVAVIQRRGA